MKLTGMKEDVKSSLSPVWWSESTVFFTKR
jgi:hypothetical protein